LSLEIQRATSEDAELVALLGRTTFAETFGYLFANHRADLDQYLDKTFSVQKIERSLGNSVNNYWIVRFDRLPVAYAKLKFPSLAPSSTSKNEAQLQKIYVLRNFLGQGIGRHLLQGVFCRATQLNASSVWLVVLAENQQAIRFYERAGLQRRGRHEFAIGAQAFDFDLLSRTFP
jgi:ribosomal protein S18 acetylase RimI-like enzyme